MPQYRAKEKGFYDNRICEPGGRHEIINTAEPLDPVPSWAVRIDTPAEDEIKEDIITNLKGQASKLKGAATRAEKKAKETDLDADKQAAAEARAAADAAVKALNEAEAAEAASDTSLDFTGGSDASADDIEIL